MSTLSCAAQVKTSTRLEESAVVITSNHKDYSFDGSFTILYSETDPKLAFRPAGIKDVKYNVPTWLASEQAKADLKQTKVSEEQA